MKHLVTLLAILSVTPLVFGQTGSLTTNVNFVQDNQCATFKLELLGEDSTYSYKGIRAGDTLDSIPIGLYYANFYSCDSAFRYGQKIEIIENEVRYFYFRNNSYIGDQQDNPFKYDDFYYIDYYDSLYAPVYFGIFWQFSRGMPFDAAHPELLNNYAFDYILGHDWLVTKPVALGYEFGFGFTQANYISEDLADPTLSHEKQRFTTFDINLGLVTSIYVKESRLLSLGARYRLPYFARYARITGNDKLTTKGLYRYNDFAVFAQLGYDWGFVFAEYRFDQYLREPLGSLPNLSIGVRLGVREEF